MSHRTEEADRLDERKFKGGRVRQTGEHGFDLRPALSMELKVESFPDGSDQVIVETVQGVNAGVVTVDMIAETVGFARFEEREDGTLVLGEFTEERTEHEGDERMQRIATEEGLNELRLSHAGRSDIQGPRQLTRLLERCAVRSRELIDVRSVGRLRPRLRDEAEQFIGRLVEGNVLEATPNLVPLGPLLRRKAIRVQ